MKVPNLLDVVLEEVGSKEVVVESDGERTVGIVREAKATVEGDDQLEKPSGTERRARAKSARRDERTNRRKQRRTSRLTSNTSQAG